MHVSCRQVRLRRPIVSKLLKFGPRFFMMILLYNDAISFSERLLAAISFIDETAEVAVDLTVDEKNELFYPQKNY